MPHPAKAGRWVTIQHAIILLLFLVNPALAQWEYGGKWIGNYTSGTGLAMVTDTVTGNSFVAWTGLNAGDYDVFIQCVDSAGYSLWDEGGKLVYGNDGFWQRYVSLLPDGDGGVFVVWTDWRNTPYEGAELYGQRISGRGALLWDPGGMKLTRGSTRHTGANLYPDNHGGFVAVYEDDANSGDIGAQRIDSEGQILWDSSGISLTSAEDLQIFPKSCAASDSTFVTIWRDLRDLQNYEFDIYMQSFDLAGNILWEPDGIPAVHWPYDQGYLYGGHDVAADGQGGAVVVWVDFRLDNIGYPVLFADRFSAQGESMWQANGRQLGFEDSNRALGCQVFKMGNRFMFIWEENGAGFDATYTNIFGDFIWEDTVRVLDPRNTYRDLVLAESDSTFVYVSRTDEGGSHKFASKIDISGNQYWPDNPYLEDFPDLIEISLDGQGGMIAAWRNNLNSSLEISRIYPDGRVGGDTTTAIYDNDRPTVPGAITLLQNYPNPFNATTTITYRGIERGVMEIFNIAGQLIRTVKLAGGEGIITWDATDDTGHPVSSGIYFIRARAAQGYMSKKIVYLR